MKIGITFTHRCWPTDLKKLARIQRYIDALSQAGAVGVPLWRPRQDDAAKIAARAEKLAGQLDGILISGGADLDPGAFGEEPLADANVTLIHPLRPAFEKQLVQAARKHKKPLLGICYGCQFFNVLEGGTLWQDIPTQLPKAMNHSDTRHTVKIEPGSLLHEIIGESEVEIASFHHQAIARPASTAHVTAQAGDGIIEAIEFDSDPFWLGVQWHPEWDPQSPATQKLFAAFVAACRQRAEVTA